MAKMQKITPFLWFDSQAEEAAKFYVSIFKNSKMLSVSRYTEAGPGPAGSAMVASFSLEGVEFNALNGGPHFKLSPAVSFVVNCDTQEEVDYYWESLSAGGNKSQCGWLEDKFGLSWQITPSIMSEMASSGDSAKVGRMMQAMMKMQKLDIQKLKDAFEGK